MKRSNIAAFWLGLAFLCLLPFVASCDRNEGPLEEAREGLEEVGDEIADEVDDAT